MASSRWPYIYGITTSVSSRSIAPLMPNCQVEGLAGVGGGQKQKCQGSKMVVQPSRNEVQAGCWPLGTYRGSAGLSARVIHPPDKSLFQSSKNRTVIA